MATNEFGTRPAAIPGAAQEGDVAAGRPLRPGEHRPLPRGVALALAVALWLVFHVVQGVARRYTPADDSDPGMPLFVADTLALLPMLVPALLIMPAMRFIAFRPRDALWLLVPLINLIYSLHFIHRFVFLPYRDWSARPDDRLHWEAIEIPGLARPLHKLTHKTPALGHNAPHRQPGAPGT